MPRVEKSISVILPAYNEEENIQECLSSVEKYLKRKFSDFEIIVVDDGSRDSTGKLVAKHQKGRPSLRLIRHPKNRGYGAALSTGFRAAKKNLVFYTDSDNQFDISDLDRLLPLIESYDIVSGYRVNRQDPLMRKFIAFVYNLLIRLSFGLRIRDVDCSFKLYKKEVFDKISLTSQTGLIDAEVLHKARRMGFTIGQTGVRHFPRISGKTMYEVGPRNQIFAFVRPEVIIELLKEIASLKKELR